jgi:hypothetical protein
MRLADIDPAALDEVGVRRRQHRWRTATTPRKSPLRMIRNRVEIELAGEEIPCPV